MKPILLIAIVAVAMIGVMVPSVFADVVITSTIGSGTPGCEVSSSCFFPSVATVNVGETIIFLNTDDTTHTFTSGSPSNGPNGIFDSSVLMSGDAFTWIPQNVGEFSYFDMTHPWMQGLIVVEPTVETTSPTNITFDSIPSTVPLDYGLIPITGQLTTSDGTPVSGKTIHLYGFLNNDLKYDGITNTNSNGYFERSLQIWQEDHPGNWEVFVYFEGDADYDSSASASRYITVEPTVTTVPITISINKSTYEDGDFLLVSGTATPNEELEIILFANAENVVAREFITVDSSGSYSTSLETFDSTYMVFGEYGVLAASQTDDRYNVVYFEFIDTTPVVTIVSTIITLDSIPSSIPLDYGPFMVTGKLTTTDGYPVSGKPVWMQANSDDGRGQGGDAITDSNGYFERELYFWHEADPGNWEVFVYFEDDADYDSSISGSRYITVEPEDVFVNLNASIDKSQYTMDDTIFLTGTVNTVLENQGITITIITPNGNIVSIEQAAISTDGTFSAQFNAGGSLWQHNGTYNVKVMYYLEEIQIPFEFVEPTVTPTLTGSTSLTFNIDPTSSTITEDYPVTFYGTLTTADGQYGIPNVTIYIKDDVTFGSDKLITTATTDNNGEFYTTWTATLRNSGAYDFYAVFNGNSELNSDRTTNHKVTVIQDTPPEPTVETTSSTNIALDSVTPNVKSGDSLFVSGKLTTSDGYPVSGKPIWLTINDEDGEGTGIFVTTNSNGQFETNFDITSGMKISDWTVQAFFDGDTNYFASVSNYRYFTVGLTIVSMTHTTLTFDYISPIQSGDSVILTGSLNTLDGTPISGKTILITIYPDNGGTGHGEYVTTNNNGNFVLDFYTTSDEDVGGWTVDAEFIGDVDYFPSSNNSQSFTVESSTVTPTLTGSTSLTFDLDPSSSTITEGHPVTFYGILTTADGQYGIPNVTIYIKDDVTFGSDKVITTATTDNNGEFYTTWTATLRNSGAYDFYAVFNGNSELNSDRTTNHKVTVIQDTPPEPISESDAGTLTVDSAKYQVSRYDPAEVHFSGIVFEYNKGFTVLVDVQYPNGETLTQKILVSSDESFSVSIFLDDDDPVGVYTINAKYRDREFSPLTFTLDKVPEVISSSTIITLDSIPSTIPLDYGPFMVTGKLTTTDGTPLSGKPVWMDADSGDGRNQGGNAITDSNGYFERELYFWHEDDPGNWEVFVYFEDDADYDSSISGSRYITVEPPSAEPTEEVTITLSTDKSTYQENEQMYVEYTISKRIPGNEDLTITLYDPNGDSFSSTIVTDYMLSFQSDNLFTTFNVLGNDWNDEGEYTIVADYAGYTSNIITVEFISTSEETPVPSTSNTILTLDPLPPSINTGESITFSGRLVTSDGVPISKQTILIKDDDSFGFDDLIAKAVTDSSGYYKNTIIAKNWDATSGGASEIYAVFDGTDIYPGDRTLIYEINVKSGIKNTTITFDKLPKSILEGETVTFSGQLLNDDGTPIEGKTIYIKQDVSLGSDSVFATLTTDENGYFTEEISFTLPRGTENLGAEFYAKWDGDSQNNSFRTQSQMIIIKASDPVKNTTVTLDPLPNKITEGESITFSGQLLTTDGIPLEGRTIYIKDDYDFDTDSIIKKTTTDSNGKFSISWSATVRYSGSYDFYAVFEGEEKAKRDRSLTYGVYVTAIVSFEPVRVFSDDTIFEAGDSLVIYGTATPNEELQVALMDSNQNLITSKTIQVTSSGSYSTTLYNWKQSTDTGDYGVVVWSAIDERYDSFWISFIESIPQVSETRLTLDRPPSSIVLNEPITFSGKLTTVDGSPIKNGHVIIATLTAQTPESLAEGYTDSSGRYSITWYAKQTSSSGVSPVYAYYGGNQVLDSTVTSLYDIKIEKPSLSVFTEKSTYDIGEQLLAYGYGNPNDRITVELKSAQGKVVNSEYSIVSSDGNYHTFFNLDNLSNGQYTIKVTSALYAISDSVSIQVESKIVTTEIDITGNVHYNYNKIPLEGIKAVLDIGAQQHIDYADSAGNFEFENIGFNPQLDYTLHFEMTDGKSFNFVDGNKYDSQSHDAYGEVISSNSMDLPLDNSKSTNHFSINLGDHLPYDYSKSYLITKGFDTQMKVVNFYSKVLNERPPIINIFLFESGSSYRPVDWDPNTGKVQGYLQPLIRILDSSMSAIGMEYTHYVQDHAYKKMGGLDRSPYTGNHYGFGNPSSGDSWVEGVGTFMPAVIADWYKLGSAGKFSNTNLEENKYKPNSTYKNWSPPQWLDEEYSIATLLWDVYDSENEAGDNTTMRINQVWKLIIGFDSFQQHNPSDYHGDKRNIKYFKDFYDYLYDESNMSGDNIDDLFLLHGIPQGWSTAGRP